MNAHTPLDQTGQAVALPANIGNLCEGRDRAIEIWMSTYDSFHAGTAAAAAASVGGKVGVSAGSDRYQDEEHFSVKFLTAPGEVEEWQDRERVKVNARERFQTVLTKSVDRRCWTDLMETTGFDRLLDAQAREEFHASLKHEPPEFNVGNVTNTFGSLWENRRDIWLRGIANVFMAMDRRFRSHDAFAIGNRLIISYAFSEWGSSWDNYKKRDQLDDIERVFRELDGQPPLPLVDPETRKIVQTPISQRIMDNGIGRLETEYFKVDRFKNRNVHFWFTNKKLLAEVNKLILEYYKPVEGDVDEAAGGYEAPLFHQTPAKNYGTFFSPAPVVEEVISRAEISHSYYDRDLGKCVDRTARILEPSAGNGAIAKAARAKGCKVTCVEIQARYAHELRQAGFDVREGDFLKLKPSDFPELFDYVVMNPPFDRGRDCDHVRHAFEFLKPGGTLVAVMSARAEFAEDARHTALHNLINRQGDKNYRGAVYGAWSDLPERSFAESGTNVNTVTLKIVKRA